MSIIEAKILWKFLAYGEKWEAHDFESDRNYDSDREDFYLHPYEAVKRFKCKAVKSSEGKSEKERDTISFSHSQNGFRKRKLLSARPSHPNAAFSSKLKINLPVKMYNREGSSPVTFVHQVGSFMKKYVPLSTSSVANPHPSPPSSSSRPSSSSSSSQLSSVPTLPPTFKKSGGKPVAATVNVSYGGGSSSAPSTTSSSECVSSEDKADFPVQATATATTLDTHD